MVRAYCDALCTLLHQEGSAVLMLLQRKCSTVPPSRVLKLPLFALLVEEESPFGVLTVSKRAPLLAEVRRTLE
jgi:hypothetical protein